MVTSMMAIALCFYLTILVAGIGGLTNIHTCLVSHNSQLQHLISDTWMFQETKIKRFPPLVQCAILCVSTVRCVAFMIHQQSGRCRLHAAQISQRTPLNSAPGFRYYDTCKVTSDTIGHPCTSDADCSLQGSQCVHARTCQCQAGYSYTPTHQACVTDCSSYGPEFVAFPDHFISRYNDRELTDDESTCPGCCALRCQQEETFVCLTFETIPGGCFLSAVTRSKVGPDDYVYDTESPRYQITHHQRQCSHND